MDAITTCTDIIAANSQTYLTVTLLLIGLFGLQKGWQNVKSIHDFVCQSKNKRLDQFKTRLEEDIMKITDMVREQAEQIKEGVSLATALTIRNGIFDNSQKNNFEVMFTSSWNNIRRAEVQIQTFRRRYVVAKRKELGKLTEKQSEASSGKWWKFGVGAVGLATAVSTAGLALAAAGTVAALGGFTGSAMEFHGQKKIENQMNKFKEFDSKVDDVRNSIEALSNQMGVEEELYRKSTVGDSYS